MDAETLERVKKKVLSLPFEPGVYIMLDKKGEVIYVGKAKRLKARVSQYFQDNSSHNEKTRKMVSNVNDFDFIVASSEFEAFMLECSLIKRHQPQYNILLKDDKGFCYIRVDTREAYPRFSTGRMPQNDGARWFGPYYGYYAALSVMNAINETLKLPNCSRVFPRDIGRERPCLNYHMKRCLAPCNNHVSLDEFRELIFQAIGILDGKYEKIANDIKAEMDTAAEELRFEKAAALRDHYKGMMRLGAKQSVIAGKLADTDVIGFYANARTAIATLRYLDGALMDKQVEIIEQSVEGTPNEILDAFLMQFYASVNRAVPKQILLPFEVDSRESLEQMLTEKAGYKVEILVPQRGDKMLNIKLAEKNAREEAERITTRADRGEKSMKLLRDALGLPDLPHRIEAFDISNLAGTDVVASLTVHINARPSKDDYRRFKIKGVEGQDDYASMREAVTRRMIHLRDGDAKFGMKPDLFLIDGGVEHAKIADDVVRSFGYEIPTYGMVKDTKHKTRALVSPDGSEVQINVNPQLFGVVGRIQEETHRFAIEYNRTLRKKRLYGSELDKIEGVGMTRRAALLKKFGSMKKIRAATAEQLADIVPKNVADNIVNYFQKEGNPQGEDI